MSENKPKPNDYGFVTIRVNIKTYHKLDELVTEKKKENLKKTGRVGDAHFDGIINDLLKNNCSTS